MIIYEFTIITINKQHLYFSDIESFMYPKFLLISVGKSIIFSCNSDDIPRWYFNNSLIYNASRLLVIHDATKAHEGLYVCRGMEYGNAFSEIGIAVVIGKCSY